MRFRRPRRPRRGRSPGHSRPCAFPGRIPCLKFVNPVAALSMYLSFRSLSFPSRQNLESSVCLALPGQCGSPRPTGGGQRLRTAGKGAVTWPRASQTGPHHPPVQAEAGPSLLAPPTASAGEGPSGPPTVGPMKAPAASHSFAPFRARSVPKRGRKGESIGLRGAEATVRECREAGKKMLDFADDPSKLLKIKVGRNRKTDDPTMYQKLNGLVESSQPCWIIKRKQTT